MPVLIGDSCLQDKIDACECIISACPIHEVTPRDLTIHPPHQMDTTLEESVIIYYINQSINQSMVLSASRAGHTRT